MRMINTIATLLTIALFACNNSSTKQDETKTKVDSSKTVIDSSKAVIDNKMADSSKNSMHVTAQFVEFTLGDASHFMFKDAAGKTWDFGDNKDATYKFSVELPKNKANESNQGWGSDKALQGKWFDITYVYKNEVTHEGGGSEKVAVITKATPK